MLRRERKIIEARDTRAIRLTKMVDELKYFRKNWETMSDLEFQLWVSRLVILYGCYYLKNTSIEIVDIIGNKELNRQEKYRRIDECFSREAKILSKYKVSL